MDNRFDRNTFEARDFLTESTETPKIKAGGSSSSNILNRYFNALAQDLALLATRTNILASRSSRLEKASMAQGGALSAAFQNVSSRVDAASGYDQVLADMHSSYYVGTSTANINYTFGQATLPVLSTTDLLVMEDPYGNKYVSSEVVVSTSNSAVSSVSLLSLTDFVVQPDGIFMLREDQTLLLDKDGVNDQVWLRIKAPLQYRGLTPNVLELYPLPAFAMILKSVNYKRAGDSDNVWYALDLSYLPGYTAGVVERFGPVRLHLPNEAISELLICFDISSVDVWGVKKLKLYHVEYDSSATLTVLDPYSRSIGNTVLRGKDPSSLSQLTVTTTVNQSQISLATTDSTSTPVITGVIMEVT